MASKSTPSRGQSAETKLIRELAKILNDTDLSEIEMEKGTLRLRVARTVGGTLVSAPIMAPNPTMPVAAAPAVESPAPESKADASAHPGVVKSPMVGTAYIRPSPDAEPFVKVGDSVKEGDTILLIEAMKTFNPITAQKSGKIADVLVEDSQPVEFGEPLFIIV